jgi:cell division protein FtsL
MKGSGKVLSIIAVVTCMLLFYVHLQIASVIVSFELSKTSKTYTARQELLRRLQFNVGQLKAPRLLEEKMKKSDLSLGLPDRVQVVEVPPVPEAVLAMKQDVKSISHYSATFSKFFGRLIQTAQAKTDTPA